MAEYRRGHKVDPTTGLTEAEARAGLTREQAEANAAAEAQPTPSADTQVPAEAQPTPSASAEQPSAAPKAGKGGLSRTMIVVIIVGGVLLLGGIIAAAVSGGGDDKSSEPAATGAANSPPPPPAPTRSVSFSEAKKAFNGDDAKDLHQRAQQFVNRAEVCIVALQLAVKSSNNDVAMATNLQDARDVCEASKTYLATENSHGFSDQATTLFASADAGKSATGAGLAYIDTLAPSKLADFQRHVQDAGGYYAQGLQDLNARLSELGVAHVKG